MVAVSDWMRAVPEYGATLPSLWRAVSDRVSGLPSVAMQPINGSSVVQLDSSSLISKESGASAALATQRPFVQESLSGQLPSLPHS